MNAIITDGRLNSYHEPDVVEMNLKSGAEKYDNPDSESYIGSKLVRRVRRRGPKRTQVFFAPADIPHGLRENDIMENDDIYNMPAPTYKTYAGLSQSLYKPHRLSENEELASILIKLIKLFNKRIVKKVPPVDRIIIAQPALQTTAFPTPGSVNNFCKNQPAIASVQSTSSDFPPLTAISLASPSISEPPQTLQSLDSVDSPTSTIGDKGAGILPPAADTSSIVPQQLLTQVPFSGTSHQLQNKLTANSMVQPDMESRPALQEIPPVVPQQPFPHSQFAGLSHQSSSKPSASPLLQSDTDTSVPNQQPRIASPLLTDIKPLVAPGQINIGVQGTPVYAGFGPSDTYVEALPPTPIRQPNMLAGASITELPSPNEVLLPAPQPSSSTFLPGDQSSASGDMMNFPATSEIQPLQQRQQVLPQQLEMQQQKQLLLPQQQVVPFPPKVPTQQSAQTPPLTQTPQSSGHGRSGVPLSDFTQSSQPSDMNALLVNPQSQLLEQVQSQQQVVLRQPPQQTVQKMPSSETGVFSTVPATVFTISKVPNYDWNYNNVPSYNPQRWDSKNYAAKQKLLEQLRTALF
ncbi:unnamed protein product [Trichobilharzia szidati]|nr:unnamed protein product [Trichobilharzia szidati]